MKLCTRCRAAKNRGDFYPDNSSLDGLAGWCKECRRIDERERRRNPRLIAQFHSRYETDMSFRAANLLKATAKRCKSEGIAFGLDAEWLAEKFAAGVCELTGLPFNMSVRSRKRNAFTPSIDRIVAGGGYTKDNCRVVLFAVNIAINDWGLDTLLPIAEALVARNRKSEAA